MQRSNVIGLLGAHRQLISNLLAVIPGQAIYDAALQPAPVVQELVLDGLGHVLYGILEFVLLLLHLIPASSASQLLITASGHACVGLESSQISNMGATGRGCKSTAELVPFL